jgi:hypothetical protein
VQLEGDRAQPYNHQWAIRLPAGEVILGRRDGISSILVRRGAEAL